VHEPERPVERQWTAGACAFVVVGLLILVPSGLCTGTWGYLIVLDIIERGDLAESLSSGFFVLAISVSFLVGAIFLIRSGLRQRKPK
jgi:uncharacterized membrane protein YjjB (DUF3815 family)